MSKYSWIVLFGLSILFLLSSAFILFVGVDPADFESSTGTAWGDFRASQPLVAQYLLRIERLLASSIFGFSLVFAVISSTVFRRGERWSWYVMWVFPLTLGLFTLIFFIHDAQGLGAYYGATAAITLLALVVAYPRFSKL